MVLHVDGALPIVMIACKCRRSITQLRSLNSQAASGEHPMQLMHCCVLVNHASTDCAGVVHLCPCVAPALAPPALPAPLPLDPPPSLASAPPPPRRRRPRRRRRRRPSAAARRLEHCRCRHQPIRPPIRQQLAVAAAKAHYALVVIIHSTYTAPPPVKCGLKRADATAAARQQRGSSTDHCSSHALTEVQGPSIRVVREDRCCLVGNEQNATTYFLFIF